MTAAMMRSEVEKKKSRSRSSQTAVLSKSEKIGPRHLDRLAIVYIRQSSMTQVHRNQESTKLQYSLVHSAGQLGWARERVLVIDDDLGMSGSSAVGREGFQRLLAEVALDHVGVILGVEMSRLARSNKDWHHLLELCARFGTLIADLDGLYDPSQYNDRLLLGLKGTMSEAELHILRQRLLQGKLQKARRGELGMPVPTGYLRKPSGEVVIDPDEEVQAVVRLVFDLFGRLGSTQGVLRELVARKVQIGVRLRMGPDIGTLVWRRPHRNMVASILRNAIYAGVYVYGRRRTDPRRQVPGRRGTGRTPLLGPDGWQVCLRDRLPAYITWEQYQMIQERLMRNRSKFEGRGIVRDGAALLQGLVVCGRCGYRLSTQYPMRNSNAYPRYVCNHAHVQYKAPLCSSLSAGCLDNVVTKAVLAALAPGALQVGMRVADEIESERAKADDLWKKRLERAHYQVERAQRQYEAVEPENRLVARTLERSWEEKLRTERELQEQHERERAKQPRHLTPQEREMIRALAVDLPRLWTASTTTTADRKAVLGLVIDKVVVIVDVESEWVDAVIHWAGGNETRSRFRRPVGRITQMQEHDKLFDRIRTLRRSGFTADRIAETLNAEGWLTPTQRNTFNGRLIRVMMHRHGYVPRGPKAPPTDDPNDWRLADLAKELEMPLVTLYGWLRRGWLKPRRVRGEWVVAADPSERRRLTKLRREHSSRPN
jgi:DNA invertase Pin-like site-specific DNA recombinase